MGEARSYVTTWRLPQVKLRREHWKGTTFPSMQRAEPRPGLCSAGSAGRLGWLVCACAVPPARGHYRLSRRRALLGHVLLPGRRPEVSLRPPPSARRFFAFRAVVTSGVTWSLRGCPELPYLGMWKRSPVYHPLDLSMSFPLYVCSHTSVLDCGLPAALARPGLQT